MRDRVTVCDDPIFFYFFLHNTSRKPRACSAWESTLSGAWRGCQRHVLCLLDLYLSLCLATSLPFAVSSSSVPYFFLRRRTSHRSRCVLGCRASRSRSRFSCEVIPSPDLLDTRPCLSIYILQRAVLDRPAEWAVGGLVKCVRVCVCVCVPSDQLSAK